MARAFSIKHEGRKFQYFVERNTEEKVYSKIKTSKCAIESGNLLSALMKQIL